MSAVEAEAREFIERHVNRVAPLRRHANLADWNAAIEGSPEAIRASAEARTAVKQVYSSKVEFDRVRGLLGSGEVADPLIRRQLVLLEHEYTANQLSAETLEDIAFREAELEGIFYNFRAVLDGRPLSNNDLQELLLTETDSGSRRRIWEASKEIGPLVADRLRELVRRRNAAARSLGFLNYYSMELALQEIDEADLFALLDDFHVQSEEPYRRLRDRLDVGMARRFRVGVSELRPWHWSDFFAQEAPRADGIDLDPIFAGVDQERLAESYFGGIGLPADAILARSDLYERQGKSQHAFCLDIDREGDVRILCNLRRDERWTRTLLHELGHAVYDDLIPRSLPYLLRRPAHTLSTEAVAMYFGRLTRDPAWLRNHVAPALEDEVAHEIRDQLRIGMLVAARWMLVMAHFERELYRDPDRPDLNRLWWDLVEEYQRIRRLEGRDQPDWATKIHLSLSPVYYHNYLLGELMASQVTHALEGATGGADSTGEFLRDRIFRPGASLHWNELLRVATGEPLSARFFLEQFLPE